MRTLTSPRPWLRAACSVLVMAMVAIVCLTALPSPAYAEGSKDLTEHGGYRAYTERNGATTFGQTRLTEIYVYAMPGETIYFGTSVCTATDRTTHENIDVSVLFPGATSDVYYNVDDGATAENKAEGFIGNRAQEVAGPNVFNADGYTPFEINVPEGESQKGGVYRFRFYSVKENGDNPTPCLVGNNEVFSESQKGSTVAAWDITVAKPGATQAEEGRVFSDTLYLNMGKNIATIDSSNAGNALRAQVFPVTNDGYRYKFDFNGMDPFGFVFFANARGLLSSQTVGIQTEVSSLFHSVKSNDNAMSDLVSHGIVLNNTPYDPDIDATYHVFFNEPSEDALKGLNIPVNPGDPSGSGVELAFEGSAPEGMNAGPNEGYVGYGGYFSFNKQTDTPETSYEITLRFDQSDPNNVVTLSNAMVDGTNRIYWDGKDAYGNAVPAGEYDGSNVSLTFKGGEVHFPLMDVEYNKNGIIVERLNGGGSDEDKHTVFYNNSLTGAGSMDSGWTAANWEVANKLNHSVEGQNSENGALAFSGNGATGDFAALDVWARYSTPVTLTNFSMKLIGLQSFTVQKEWIGTLPSTESLPDTLEVELLVDGDSFDPSKTASLSEVNGWTHTWNNLDSSYTYTAVEKDVPDGFHQLDPVNTKTKTTLRNAYIQPSESITVSKVWLGAGNDDSVPATMLPSSLSVSFYAVDAITGAVADTATKVLTLESENEWEATWDDTDTDVKPDPTVKYLVVEEALDNFVLESMTDTTTVDTANNKTTRTVEFKNRYSPTTTSVTVNKAWTGIPDGFGGTIPDASVHLLQNGSDSFTYADGTSVTSAQTLEPGSASSGSTNNFEAQYTWSNLPKHDDAGSEYMYTVVEDVPTGYELTTSQENGSDAIVFNLTNTFVPVSSVQVVKTWDNAADMDPPTSLEVELLKKNGTDEDSLGTREMDASTYWTATWPNIYPLVDGEEYVVTEVLDDRKDYVQADSNSSAATSFTVNDGTNTITHYAKDLTNTYPTYSVHGVTQWYDSPDPASRPENTVVQLLRETSSGTWEAVPDANGNPRTAAGKTADGTWFFEFTDLPRLRHDGTPYVYGVREVNEHNALIEVGGTYTPVKGTYDVTYAGDQDEGFIIVNRLEVAQNTPGDGGGTSTTSKPLAHTGDSTPLLPWLCGAGAAVLIAVFAWRRSKLRK